MMLTFIDQIGGFVVKSTSSLDHGINDDLSGVVGDNCELNEKDELVYFDFVFRYLPIEDIKSIIIEANDNPIIGSYTIPELNIKDVSFIEVLQAVKNYYAKKQTDQVKRKKVV